MKIVLVNAVFGYGSTGVIVEDLYNGIKKLGDQAYIVYSTAKENTVCGYKIGGKIDRLFHAVYTRFFGMQGYASKRVSKKLIKYFNLINPDVLHLHNLHANYINMPILLNYCAKKNIKVIVTLHDCWFFTGKCFHFVESNCEKWKTECQECPRNKLDVKSYFFDMTKKVFNDKKKLFDNIKDITIVGCSDWISNLARESAIFRDKRIVTIRNGIDLETFQPTIRKFRNEYGLQNKFIILGMASKWSHQDNNNTVVDLLSMLSDKFVVVLIGCNFNSVEQFNSDKVIKLDFVADKNVLADIYSSADVFVNLTLADTLPTVNMESIACGTPVVTYNVGGSPELVVDGQTGYIIEKFDVDTLKKAIDKVEQGKISRLACRTYAEHYFDKKKNYNQYFDLYKA